MALPIDDAPGHTLDTLFGAILMGTLVSCALYGLTSHQFFRYYRMFPRDPSKLQQFVGALWVLDTVCIVLTMHASYNYTVTHHARPLEELDIVWSLRMIVFLTGLLALLTHVFFVFRIHKLSRRNFWITAIIAATAVIRIGLSIATTALTFVVSNFGKFLQQRSHIVDFTMGSAALSDIALTAALFYFLCTSQKGFSTSDTFFDKILVYLVNTGLLRSVLAVVSLICSLAMRSNLVFLGIYFIFSKLYTNSFMAVLNARRNTYVPSQIGSFDLGHEFVAAPGIVTKGQPGALTVHITQEYHTTVDHQRTSMDSTQNTLNRTSSVKSGSLGHVNVV